MRRRLDNQSTVRTKDGYQERLSVAVDDRVRWGNEICRHQMESARTAQERSGHKIGC